jgi:hypothetical protein
MGHLRKTKTSRRVKRTKTDKRNNTQKRRRNQTFRKNRRVNRGGNGTKRNREEEMHDYEKILIEAEKDEENMNKRLKNMEKNMYREPLGKGYSKEDELVEVNPDSQLEITETQQRFNDDIDAEEMPEGEEGGIWFGGKKKRAIHKK